MDHKLRWKRIRALWGRTNWKEIVSTFSGSISALERSFKTIEKSFSRHEVVSVFLQLSKTYEAPLTHCKSAKLHTLHIIIIIGCELKLDLFNLEVGLPRKYISCVKGSVRTGRLDRNGATLSYFISIFIYINYIYYIHIYIIYIYIYIILYPAWRDLSELADLIERGNSLLFYISCSMGMGVRHIWNEK